MHNQERSFVDNLAWLKQTDVLASLKDIKHGIERESLRVTPNGKLSQASHSAKLGSALTHSHITTDFAESLLEFITPPSNDISETFAQLYDIHRYTLEQLGQEQLWPLSMPCFVGQEDDIRLAEYGHSNIGQMKHIYRVGLKHRYGSMMQVIAGVHFNFSLPKEFWEHWAQLHGLKLNQDTISQGYLHLIRNYRRMCWIIPYLFGASPAICSSFLQNRAPKYDFHSLGKGTLYLPYATSLRMSDLGYTNSAQNDLNISYNSLPEYIKSVRSAIDTASSEYAHIPAGQDGLYQQLNSNVLQIENELYSPIRPKQVAESGEKPSTALEKRGIEYIEVRALDLDPFSPVGVNHHQVQWLDCFLLYCLLSPSPELSNEQYQQTERNLEKVVLRGREPGLQLEHGLNVISLQQWGLRINSDLLQIAELLDSHASKSDFAAAVQAQESKLIDGNHTPSGQLLTTLLDKSTDNSSYGMALAELHKNALLAHDYQAFDDAYFERLAQESIAQQVAIEKADDVDFSTFLNDYFRYDK